MAKPVITDKPVIDQAEFNGVTIWRKEGGSIDEKTLAAFNADCEKNGCKKGVWR